TASNTVSLTVNKATPVITWSNPLIPLPYPSPLSSSQLNASASVPGTLTYSPTNGTVLNVGTNTVVVNFTPVDTNNYNSVTITNTVVVGKATPTITWTNPAAIAYGTALSATQLNATSSVAGTFVYNPTNGSVLNAGTNTLTAVFTASNTTNYISPVTNTVSLVVNKASPVLTWTPSPATSLTYPTALSSTQLNATSSVAGTFSYNPSSGTVMNAGTNTLVATFTPSNTTNYTSSGTITNTVTVAKGSQNIIFGSLPIKYVGDAAFNLTATASSGLTVTYTSSNTNVATVLGSLVTIIGEGNTTITANQAGDSNWNAAVSMPQTLTVQSALNRGLVAYYP
ncbi:MAG: hypothetical protein EBZ78_13920, partial [Verrucomicrobia bacterium]|nr:hypothetical protein [Verrucomicrobiota bacterium]